MVDRPNEEKNHSNNPQQGARDQIRGTLAGTVRETVHTANETQSVKPQWWQQPEHIIQVFILLFVASYTVLTYCLLLTSKDTEKRQLRAYIGVVSPPDNQRINRFFPPEVPIIKLSARNFGQTPAYKVTYIAGMGVRAWPLPKDNDYSLQPEIGFNPVTIFPGMFDLGDIKIISKRALTTDEIALFQDGMKNRLYAWGTVNYEDAFGASHYTNFCIGFFGLTQTNIQFEPCEKHTDSN